MPLETTLTALTKVLSINKISTYISFLHFFSGEETLFQVSHIDRVYLLRAETTNER